MDKIGVYKEKPFTINRRNVALISGEGSKKLAIHALLEFDVTKAKECMQQLKNQGIDISFTAWIVTCVAHAVSEHKSLNSYRQGRKKIVVFEDVDVPVPIERNDGDEVRIVPYIVRGAHKKSVQEITREIRSAQQQTIDASTQVLGKNLTRFEQWVVHAPMWMKKLLLFIVRYRGILKKKHMGTVGVSAIGMKGEIPGWIIPRGGPIAVLCVVSGIQKKPGVVNDMIMVREYLHMTITVDHVLVDGGPLARFLERLTELIESAYGLQEQK